MKSLFSVLFVILNFLSIKQGICTEHLDEYVCKDNSNNPPMQRLKEYLFCNYDTEVRPTENYRNSTVVNFGLHVNQFEVDDLANVADFYVWVKMVWVDPHLTWKPSQFNNINSVHAMSYDLWVPDIVMHSATNMGIDMEIPTVECQVYHEGTVYCVPSMVYTTFCESDHTWWPYDMMNCTVQLASWSYSSNEIDLRFDHFQIEGQLTVDISDRNSQWEIVNFSHSQRIMGSKFGSDFTSNMLSYHILLKRYSSMYSAVYTTMAIVLMAMTLMALWLEPKSTERMIIANLNFVVHLLCLTDLQWKLPFNGTRPPQLILFYENSFVLAAFSLMLTSILRYLQELNTDAPTWISSSTVSILKSRVGQIFLVRILDPKVSARIEMNADDNTNLVSLDKKGSTWRYTSILIGWLAFISILFVYVIMLIVYILANRFASCSSFNA